MQNETQEFLNLFQPGEVTDLLAEVARKQFEEEMIICDGMWMGTSRRDSLKYHIPEENFEAYKDKVLLIAKATHSGSSLGFFRAPGTSNVDEYPVLVFGDEGGTLVIAEGFRNYLAFATLNASPYIETAYRDGEKDKFDLMMGDAEWENDDYVQWAHGQGIPILRSLVEAQAHIITPAQAKYQDMIDEIFDFGF